MTMALPGLDAFGDVPPKALAELLRSLVGPTPPTTGALALVAAAAAGQADPGVQKLLPLAAARLDLSACALDTRQALATRRRQAEIRAMVLHKVAQTIGTDLVSHGVVPLFLKGFALAVDWYDQSWQRPMGDLDIAVRPHQFAAAVERLRVHDFVLGSENTEIVAPLVGINTHALTLRHPRNRQTVDLHHHVLGASIWPGADDGFWREARPFRAGDVPGMLTLAPEHHLVHACLHGYARSIGQVSVRWIVDACTILKRSGPAFRWDLVETEAARHRCGPVLAAALDYVAGIADVAIPAAVLRRLAESPAQTFDLAYFRVTRDTVHTPTLANRIRLRWHLLQRQRGRRFTNPLQFALALRRYWGSPSWWAMARSAWTLRRQSAHVTARRSLWLDPPRR